MTALLDIYFLSSGVGFAFIVISALSGGLGRGHGGADGGGHAIGHGGADGGGHAIGHAAMGHSSAHTGAGHAAMGHSGAHTGAGHAAMGHSGAHTGAGHADMGHSGAHTGAGHADMGHSGAHTGAGHAVMGESGTHAGAGHAVAGDAGAQTGDAVPTNLQDAAHVLTKSGAVTRQASESTSLSLKILDVVNPMKWALRAFIFGAVGVVSIKLLPPFLAMLSLVPAIIIGWVAANSFLCLMGCMVSRMYSSTNFSKQSLIGALGELTISMPAGATGEVVVSTGSSRYTSPAKAHNPAQSLDRLAKVVVVDIRDGVLIVEPFDEQDFSAAG
jgi:hypothetical protein